MKDRFFRKLDWAAFWTATIITFAVYFLTLGPSVGLEDSGELATAAANLGVPHPPGYPFWTFCCWLFCKAFSWVTYMGHPTPAWAVSCCSALFGAFAAGCTAMLICRSAHDFVSGGESDAACTAGGEPSSRILGGDVSGLLCFGGGVGGALTFAFSPVEWSQSTIVEIYSLNALFLMWVFLLSYRWMRRPSDKMLWFTAFVFGLGLTNYQVLLFAIVPLAIIIAMRNIGLFRDVFAYLMPVGMTWQVLKIGSLMRADRTMQADVINKHEAIVGRAVSTPSSTVVVIAVVALVASIVAAAVLKRRGDSERAGKVVLYGGGFGAALLMLASFVFVGDNVWSGITAPVAPLIAPTRYALVAAFAAASVVAAAVAALRDDERLSAPVSLKFVIASAAFALAAVVVAATVPQAGDGGFLGAKFPWGKSTFMFWTMVAALFALTAFTRRGLCFAIPVAGLHIAVFTLLSHGAMNGLTHPQSWWFGWPIAWNFVVLALAWVTLPNGRSVAGAAFFAQLGISFYAYMPIVSDLRNPPMNWGYPRTWEGFKHAIMRGQYEAIGVPSFPSVGAFFSFMGTQMKHYFGDVMVQFTDLLVPFALVPFVAAKWVVDKAHRKTFWQWMSAALACFLMMSGLLILLANVKGDVQDGFIQKVKFISSHAMIALWIGYGLVFASVLLLRRLRVRLADGRFGVVAAAVAAAMIAVCAIYPIVQNYTDDRLVFELGGSEQNGHTFGWQFGAYQLEGAKAIREQLVADEEPLPDPDWPEPMEPFSIFFGGTDPGRFVPTYMIYSALFRPDVYLITQNALADDTYMSVERDLYGDEIWIPSKEDSAESFNIYVNEVQSGKRQANAALKIENGRVQVTGALGVMEINGILTKMMFDHERLRHAFYVEESYVIRWMYDYLTPHGLIMKINKDANPLNQDIARNDMEFWDWYQRRLLRDPAFRRDFPAQKSFSKLRAAIAGLYANRGYIREADAAFREACLLYPASPEATFRYAQEVLLPLRRWDVITDLLDYTDLVDPNNSRTGNMRDYVTRIKSVTEEIARLRQEAAKGPLAPEQLFRLAQSHAALGQASAAVGTLKRLLSAPGEKSFDLLLASAQLYAQCGQRGEAAKTLKDALGKAPPNLDPNLQRGMAAIFAEGGMNAEADACLNAFLRASPNDIDAWMQLAVIKDALGLVQESQNAIIQAYRLNANEAARRLQSSEQLQRIAAPLFRRRQP